MSKSTSDTNDSGLPNEGASPFSLRDAFPDAQGIFDTKYLTLDEVKSNCFVALDANVLLLPFKLDGVDLNAVVEVYRHLSSDGRLIIPAQAAREFAKHRANKVGELVKYLRDEASSPGPKLKKIGALSQHDGYLSLRKSLNELGGQIRLVQKSILELADSIAANVGEDPVSSAYRTIFRACVRPDPQSCEDESNFRAELRTRFEARRPPGFKDKGKPDEGAGDLLIWKTILLEADRRATNCIFVTADEKADWYTQSGGPFQPRFELIEEFRSVHGHTLHIIPLSRLLRLYDASGSVVEEVRDAEKHDSNLEKQVELFTNYQNEITGRSLINFDEDTQVEELDERLQALKLYYIDNKEDLLPKERKKFIDTIASLEKERDAVSLKKLIVFLKSLSVD